MGIIYDGLIEGGTELKNKLMMTIVMIMTWALAIFVLWKNPEVMPHAVQRFFSSDTDMLVVSSAEESNILAQTTMVSAVEEATIYMTHLHDYFPMGTLSKDEMVHIEDETADWYIIKWGNGDGFIKKDEMIESIPQELQPPTELENSQTVIYTTENTKIYTSDSTTSTPIGHINAGFRYPVIQEYNHDWWKINIGNRTGYISKATTAIDQGIPVLMYHHILTPEEKINSPFSNSSTTMTTVEFEEQMKYLHDEHFTTIKTEDLYDYLNGEKNLPAKSVLLTMDDGNISSRIYGYPILQKYKVHIDQFIITSRTPREPLPFDHQTLTFLSQQEMDEMTDHYGYHSHTHAMHSLTEDQTGYLLTKTDEEIVDDLIHSRHSLEDTSFLAYPFGQYDEHVIELAKESGITLAFTTTGGYTTLESDFMRIPRFGIEPNVTLPEFIEKVQLPIPLTEVAPVIPSIQ